MSVSLAPRLAGLAGLGAFLLVLGLRFSLLQTYGSDLPFHDQWDAEALHLLRPMQAGADVVPGIFRFHNEHHPVFTKLISLGLAKADGMWNAWPQMLLNTVFQGLIVVMISRLARRQLAPLPAWLVTIAAAVTLSLPVLWENLLWGFQSQFYLAILLGLVHLEFTWSSPRLGWRWVVGALAGVATLGTMASGFLSVLISGGVAFLRLKAAGPNRTHAVATVSLAGLVSLAGFWLINPVPYPAVARSVFSAVEAYSVLATWPFQREGAVFLLQLPCLALLLGQFGRESERPSQPWLLALVLWLAAVTAAFAYGRAELIESATDRYCDFLTVQCLVSLVCLLQFSATQSRRDWRVHGVVALWILGASWGFYAARQTVITDHVLADRAALQAAQRELVRDFVLRDDPAALLSDSLPATLIHSVPSHRLNLLRDPGMRALLPPSVRHPLDGVAAPASRGISRVQFNAKDNLTPGWTLTPTSANSYLLSESIAPESFPLLRLRVSGGVDNAAHRLRLLVGPEGRVVESLGSTRSLAPQYLNFPMPEAPFRIEAEAAAGSGSLSFSDPVSFSRLSWLSGKLLGAHVYFLVAGLIVLAGAGGGAWVGRAVPHPAVGRPIRGPWKQIFAAILGGVLPLVGLFLWPHPLTFSLAAREALLLDPAAWDAQPVPEFRLEASESGQVAPTLGGVYATVASAGTFFGTYGRHGDADTADGVSVPFKIEAPWLCLPVVGYPQSPGNQLLVELLDPTGAVSQTLAYADGNPSERPQLWLLDLAGHVGGSARVHWVDHTLGHQGWLGFGAPWMTSDPGVHGRWKRFADSNRLLWLRTLFLGAGVLTVVILTGRKFFPRAPHSPRPPLLWP